MGVTYCDYQSEVWNRLSNEMKEITITGFVSKILNKYVITTDDGMEYELSAIMPWEAVSPDFGSSDYAIHLGKRMVASGVTDGSTIWKASLSDI